MLSIHTPQSGKDSNMNGHVSMEIETTGLSGPLIVMHKPDLMRTIISAIPKVGGVSLFITATGGEKEKLEFRITFVTSEPKSWLVRRKVKKITEAFLQNRGLVIARPVKKKNRSR